METANAIFSRRIAAVLLTVAFACDTKIVDFSANGVETGFLMLFLAWTLYALLTTPPRLAVHLGVAWAGLMSTTPDSFIYIGVLASAAWLFSPRDAVPGSRWRLLKT